LNKADIKDTWQISDADLQPLVSRGWTLIEASARSGDSVEALFHELASRMLRKDDESRRSAAGA
jgi:hypothetical protein